jgi:hypothetical protein
MNKRTSCVPTGPQFPGITIDEPTRVVVRIHVDDYHDTRDKQVEDYKGLQDLVMGLSRGWEIPVARIRVERRPFYVEVTIDE